MGSRRVWSSVFNSHSGEVSAERATCQRGTHSPKGHVVTSFPGSAQLYAHVEGMDRAGRGGREGQGGLRGGCLEGETSGRFWALGSVVWLP